MREMVELLEEIARQRYRVDNLCVRGMTDEDFVRENRRLDLLIEEYIELEIQEKQLLS